MQNGDKGVPLLDRKHKDYGLNENKINQFIEILKGNE